MRVLFLGATGSIGTAVAAELARHGHEVVALARSDKSAAALDRLGYEVLRGDMRAPEPWVAAVRDVDALIHAAATFTDDDADLDRQLLPMLRDARRGQPGRLRFVYTGGCWLYGETGDRVATDGTPFAPIASSAWVIPCAEFLAECPEFDTVVIHPAMVYEHDGGVFEDFLQQAKDGHPIEIWGNGQVRWPLIHCDDLAVAYRLLLERPGLGGHFNASAETGVRVGAITDHIAQIMGSDAPAVELSCAEVLRAHGAWAEGPTIDQQMAAPRLTQETGWTPVHTDFRLAVVPAGAG